MGAAPEGRGNTLDQGVRWVPSVVNLMRFLLALFVSAGIAYWFYFDRYLARTIVVDAETGTLSVVLEAELSGKAFRELWYCKQIRSDEEPVRTDDGAGAVPPSAAGCPSRTHHWVGPVDVATPVLPAGTELEITSWPRALRIDVKAVPGRYDNTDIARLEGGALLLASPEGLEALGTLPLNGKIEIGALSSETDRLSIVSGSYQVRGYTLTGLLSREMRQLRGGSLLAGALVRFVEPGGATATGYVAVMLPDPENSLMRVTAISASRPEANSAWEPANNNMGIRYYFTDEVVIRPSFFEALILDPLLQLVAMVFGAIAGYGWLKRLLRAGSRNKSR